ncbi:MAG TPA: UPF0182 family protein [Syntrophales bacterium]|jgi:hypothetical protein|nr:UPF0182 family protein [Syntrophales bacterium]HON23344.1 UPF0182 family protein [Syntrophales bacterium]HOU78311.1 UPF0182 family protein [Syntrophales bacterium]HPC31783.1 UPF0182 family protein [Syntrophales bacterium]HQG33526.1 UPF0182 family protein [Syntrophales bacterium]
MKKANIIFISILLIILVVAPLFSSLLNLYIDWLFFNETGYTAVFSTTLLTQAGSGLCFGTLFFVVALANLILARRLEFTRPDRYNITGTPITINLAPLRTLQRVVTFFILVVVAFMMGKWGASLWSEVLMFANAVPAGQSDPVFGKDIGFYLFKYPFFESLKQFVDFTIVLSAILAGIVYFLGGGILLNQRQIMIDPRVKRHLGILVGLLIINMGPGFYLESLKMLYAEHGVIFGASYTDVHAKLTAYRLLGFLAPLAGAAMITGMFRSQRNLTLISLGTLFAVYLLGILVYPAVLQKFKVAPNEMIMETPYIENNIRMTRFGYDLDRIQEIPFDVAYNLTGRDIDKNDATIRNIRLWDHAPLLRTYSQLQQIRTYYRFQDVDNDRYQVNGQYLQVMLSPRELSYADLPSKNWINERLIFTHGNGLTLGPVSRISREGLPEFFIKDIPPAGTTDLKVKRPEIYYGEMSNDYVIVKTKIPEFSYPTPEGGNIYTSYGGTGGVETGSLSRRLLFSLKYQTEKILFSSDITGDSKILFFRNVRERFQKIAPFLVFDKDPYLVITDEGRLVWMVDAYTTSSRLPYSKPAIRRINYVRNAVKATLDAYNGTVNYYVSDPTDKIVQVYMRIFPSLFKDMAALPADLKRHIRYPQWLLQLQASVYAAYHMTDPKIFYNKENLWEIPVFEEKMMEPYYTIMKLPSEKQEEYILLLPYTPAKRDNLAAWLAARCDAPHYGKLVVYTFPRDRLVFGPKQVDARINQDSYISQQLTLWNQRGSRVIRGSLLVIPVERSLLYVQPLYLAAADTVGLPELRRVIVAYENEVVMEENLELSLQRLFGARKAGTVPAASPGGTASSSPASAGSPSLKELAAEAMKTYQRATEMQRQGNWSGYGEEIRKLEVLLKKMAN